MLSRLLITLGLIFLFNIQSSIVIAIGILISFGFGLIPFEFKNLRFKTSIRLEAKQSKQVRNFFIITAFYELTQIIINKTQVQVLTKICICIQWMYFAFLLVNLVSLFSTVYLSWQAVRSSIRDKPAFLSSDFPILTILCIENGDRGEGWSANHLIISLCISSDDLDCKIKSYHQIAIAILSDLRSFYYF